MSLCRRGNQRKSEISGQAKKVVLPVKAARPLWGAGGSNGWRPFVPEAVDLKDLE